MDSGQALLDLEGKDLLPPPGTGPAGVFLAYRAASYLDLKEPEPAAAATTESLLLAPRTGAPRCAAEPSPPREGHIHDVPR